jgi:hypothetical protein
MRDLVLPAFEMDCRDWIVVTPDQDDQDGFADEVAGAPVVAMLSTVVLDNGGFAPTSGVLTLGLLDDDVPPLRPVDDAPVAAELVDADPDADTRRYVLAAPGRQLALLAEFTLPDGPDPAVVSRIESLMSSFRWAA